MGDLFFFSSFFWVFDFFFCLLFGCFWFCLGWLSEHFFLFGLSVSVLVLVWLFVLFGFALPCVFLKPKNSFLFGFVCLVGFCSTQVYICTSARKREAQSLFTMGSSIWDGGGLVILREQHREVVDAWRISVLFLLVGTSLFCSFYLLAGWLCVQALFCSWCFFSFLSLLLRRITERQDPKGRGGGGCLFCFYHNRIGRGDSAD